MVNGHHGLHTLIITGQSTHERNVFTVPLIKVRQSGQSLTLGEQTSQQIRWPQGRKTVLISLSMHTLQRRASLRRAFSSINSCSSEKQKRNIFINNLLDTKLYTYNCLNHIMEWLQMESSLQSLLKKC